MWQRSTVQFKRVTPNTSVFYASCAYSNTYLIATYEITAFKFMLMHIDHKGNILFQKDYPVRPDAKIKMLIDKQVVIFYRQSKVFELLNLQTYKTQHFTSPNIPVMSNAVQLFVFPETKLVALAIVEAIFPGNFPATINYFNAENQKQVLCFQFKLDNKYKSCAVDRHSKIAIFNKTSMTEFEKATEQDQAQLMKKLIKLHQRNYVHNDITPNNIMFSPTFKKLIFIDYGFSDLIAEPIGYKTFTGFQGTPNFVSKDMLNLFSVDDKKDYIDLYYNDLVALQNSIRYLNGTLQIQDWKGNENNILDRSIGQIGKDIAQKQMKRGNPSNFYPLVLLQWHCLVDKNIQKVKMLLNYQNRILVKCYGISILQLLSFNISPEFNKQILFEQLSELRHTEQYSNLCKMIRVQTANIFRGYHLPYNRPMVPPEWVLSQQMQYFLDSDCRSQPYYGLQAIKCVKSKQFYELCQNKLIYYCLVFDIIRLDWPYTSLQTKESVASCFLEYSGIKITQSADPLISAKTAIKYILHKLLQISLKESDYSYHIIRFRLTLIVHALIAEIDIISQLETQIQLLQTQRYNFKEAIEFFCYIFYDIQFMKLKFSFSNVQLSIQIKHQLNRCLSKIQQKIKQQFNSSSDLSTASIANLLQQIIKYKQYDPEKNIQIEQKINQINDEFINQSIAKIYSQKLLEALNYVNLEHLRKKILKALRCDFIGRNFMNSFVSFFEEIYWMNVFAAQDKYEKISKIIQKKLVDRLNHYPFYINIKIMLFGLNTNVPSKNYEKIISNYLHSCTKDGMITHFGYQFKFAIILAKKIQKKDNKIIEQICKMYVATLSQQINFTIDEYQKRDDQKFQKNGETAIQHVGFMSLKIIHLQRRVAMPLIETLQSKMHNLYWFLLNRYANANSLSQYDSFLLHHYFNSKTVIRTTYKISDKRLQDVSFQMCVMEKLPQSLKMKFLSMNIDNFDFIKTRLQTQKINNFVIFDIYFTSAFIYVWKTCLMNQQFDHYFQFKQPYIRDIKITLKILKQLETRDQKQYISHFLQVLAIKIGEQPNSLQYNKFQKNIYLFFCEEPSYFATIKDYHLPLLKWQHRYLLFYYAIALDQQVSSQRQIQLMKFISKNMFMHTYPSKYIILIIYYVKALKLRAYSMDNIRKQSFIIRKFMVSLFPYIIYYYGYRSAQFQDFLIKQFKLKQTHNNKFRKSIKKRIKKMVSGYKIPFKNDGVGEF